MCGGDRVRGGVKKRERGREMDEIWMRKTGGMILS